MLERIVVRHQSQLDPENPLDLGALAEAMLFYGYVAVVANRPAIRQLLKSAGPDGLVSLVKNCHLHLLIPENFTTIGTTAAGTPEARYDAGLAEIRVNKGSPPMGIERAIVAEDFIAAAEGRQGRGRRLARQVAQLASTTRIHQRVAAQIHADLRDTPFLSSAVLDVLRALAPEYTPPRETFFALEDDGTGRLALRTNVDFFSANQSYRKYVGPEHSTLDPGYLLATIVAARELVDDAAERNAELACDSLNARLIQRRVSDVLQARAHSEAELARFVELTLKDGRAIREAVNIGTRSLRDLFPVLERSQEFRSWLAMKAADGNLVEEYFKEITKETWVDRLPTKTVRWMLFTGAGLALDLAGAGGVGTATGVALSAGDTFLLDRLIKGWRPNQFINGPLKAFVGETDLPRKTGPGSV